MSNNINQINKKGKYQNKSLPKEIESRYNQSPKGKGIINKMTNNHISINNYNIISNLTKETMKNKPKLVSNNIIYEKKEKKMKSPVILEIDSEISQNSTSNKTNKLNFKSSSSSSSLILIDKEKDKEHPSNSLLINRNKNNITRTNNRIVYNNNSSEKKKKEEMNSRNKLQRYHSISNTNHNQNNNRNNERINISITSDYDYDYDKTNKKERKNNDCIVFTRLETKINIINNIISQLNTLRKVLSEEEEGKSSKTILKRSLNLERISFNFIEFSKDLLNYSINNSEYKDSKEGKFKDIDLLLYYMYMIIYYMQIHIHIQIHMQLLCILSIIINRHLFI